MELFNLLETGIPVFGQTFDVSLNWIGKLIRWLCEGVGVVGVGIILFSLILKLITLPFDIYQRISMRKQNLQMKANQEQMAKLQQQYANDKEKYNQKVMEMYKENGISIFSSCLPMILSMVIFIVAINAFNAFAQYSNIENYNTMVDAYNANIKSHSVLLTEENYDSVVSVDANGRTYTVKDGASDKYVYYQIVLSEEESARVAALSKEEKTAYMQKFANKDYFVDEVKAYENDADIKAYVDNHKDVTKGEAVKAYLVSSAQDSVEEVYNSTVKKNTSFGWIKNIWVTDASYKNPVLSHKEFVTEAKREKFKVEDSKIKYSKMSEYTTAYQEDSYNLVTAKLDKQKDVANGYFILIALSIGTILLQQFVMQRSQKEQQKFSSVDGQAGTQQKMTMIIMTGMFAIFSFMYSSAFSIYMITSNLFSLLSTLVINKFVDMKAEKKEVEASIKRYQNDALDRIEQAKNAGKASAEESKKKNK